MRDLVARFAADPLPLERVEERRIAGPGGEIPLRIYWPSLQHGLPVLVYFHGGGFRVGDLETHDGICRALSKKAEVLVVAVDYRLAPEHPYPAAVDDCYAAVEWVSSNAPEIGADPKRLAVGGDSAGGNLAAVTTLRARNLEGPEIVFALLVYPVTDMSSFDTASWRSFGSDYFPTQEMIVYMRHEYVASSADRANPEVSPLLAADHSGLPPTLVITAGFDPLRDEGEAYADKLGAAGVAARKMRYEGVIHGFFGIPFFRKGRRALDDAADALKEALGQNPG